MNKAFHTLPLLLLSLMAGCTVGPDYQRPAVKSPSQWSSSMAGGETNSSIASTAWWKSFHDEELNSLITRAAQSNLDLHAAAARVREARAAAAMISGKYWPDLDTSASYTAERLSKNGFPSFPPGIRLQSDVYQAGFDAAWEVDVFGGTRRAVEAAKTDLAATEYGRRDVLISLLGEVARNYVEARGFQQRLVIARQNIQAEQDTLNLTRSRYKGGLTSDLDVQQAAALLATTEAEIPTLQTGFNTAAYRLGVLLGQGPDAVLQELSPEGPLPATPPIVPVGLPSQLLLRRPDIQQAERELAGASARIGQATADLYPRFSLTGDAGLQSIGVDDWFSAGSRFWSAGPSVQWKIFYAGQIRNNIRVQNAREQQALDHYQQTVLTSFEDVENALTAYAREQIRHQSLAQAVQANQQALQIADQLYQKGLVDFLRVLESQRSLYSSQDTLVQSQQTVILDLIQLYKVLGGGWDS